MTDGDDRALLRDARLALDHRGDDEDVVGVEVAAPRGGHVHLGEVRAEGVELAVAERRGARAVAQLVRRREQEALEGAVGGRAVAAQAEVGRRLGRRVHVAALQPRLLRDRGDVAARAALGDRDVDDRRRLRVARLRAQRVDGGAVAHVVAQDVTAGAQVAARAGEAGADREDEARVDDARVREDVADLPRAGALGDRHGDAAGPVAAEGLGERVDEPQQEDDHDEDGHDRGDPRRAAAAACAGAARHVAGRGHDGPAAPAAAPRPALAAPRRRGLGVRQAACRAPGAARRARAGSGAAGGREWAHRAWRRPARRCRGRRGRRRAACRRGRRRPRRTRTPAWRGPRTRAPDRAPAVGAGGDRAPRPRRRA